MTRAPLFLMLLVFGVVSPAGAGPNVNPTVTIRTYNYAQVADEGLANARATADVIFDAAGISLAWADCRVPQRDSGAECMAPLDQGRDLILRLMDRLGDAPAPGGRVLALGTSMLDHERRGGVMMTVELLPIRAIAGGTPAGVWTVLGRAIAHEIGHLLLGTGEHPGAGLMRALWSHDELRGIRPAHWQFSPREAAQMRRGLALNARASN